MSSSIRDFLLVALLAAGCGGPPGTDEPTAGGITHGPILGGLGEDRIGVWARTAGAGEFRVHYGTDPDRLDAVSPPAATAAERDFTGVAWIEDLSPGTAYYYEVATGDRPAGVERLRGRFHTLPSSEQVADPETNPDGRFNLRFEFACGNNQGAGDGSAFGPALPTFATLNRELVREDEKSRVDFAILNGDWLYEDARDYSADEWLTANGQTAPPRPLEIMPALAGVWENYKVYLERGRNLADWHRHVPSFFTFDDHEILNDVYGAAEPGRRDRRAVFRDIGVKAWYDYLGWSNEIDAPRDILYGRAALQAGEDLLRDEEADFSALDPSEAATLHVHWGTPDAGVNGGVDDEEGGDANARVYGVEEVVDAQTLRVSPPAVADGEVSYSIGRRSYFRKTFGNADFFFLDTRTHREMHDTENRRANKTMLGAAQKAWLKGAMSSSRADFLFVVSSVNFSIPHVGGTGGMNATTAGKDDAWTVFLVEREEMLDFWDSLDKPVFVLTGDLHNSFAIKITDRVWEFASGPHNSMNHPASSEGERPPNGEFDSFGREVEIRWSSYIKTGTPLSMRKRPVYCVVRVNNVFRNDRDQGPPRWIAYPVPQAVFQYHDGLTGELLYAESILAK